MLRLLRRARIRRQVWVVPYLLFLVALAILAPFAYAIAPHDPIAQSLGNRLGPPAVFGGKPEYLFGTDGLGRDILSRLLVGAQASLAVGFVGVLIGSIVGSVIGIFAGYRGGRIDEVLMAIGDVQLSFPFILLAIAIVAVLGPSLQNLIVVVGLSGWVTYARVARSMTLRIKSEDYVLAVRAIGGRDRRILYRHVLPNFVPTLIVLATLDMPRLIILESTLSFLGLGIQPPTPSWGGMVADGRAYLESAWWIGVAPGLALMLTTLSINRIGDWLRGILDPALRQAA